MKSKLDGKNLGLAVIRETCRLMQIDSEWSQWRSNGVTWWAGALAQKAWVEFVGDTEVATIHVRTDLLKGFEGTPKQMGLLAGLSTFATLSGWVPDPEDPSRLQFASRIIVEPRTRAHLQNLLSWVMAIQAAEAYITVHSLAELLNGQPASSEHPKSGFRSECDDMLYIVRDCILPQGRKLERQLFFWIQALRSGLETTGGLTSSDKESLTIRLPLGDLDCRVEAAITDNPRMGLGVLVVLKLPLDWSALERPASALEFNGWELAHQTGHFLGSWCRSPEGTLSFVSFVPAVVCQSGLLDSIFDSVLARAHRVREIVPRHHQTSVALPKGFGAVLPLEKPRIC